MSIITTTISTLTYPVTFLYSLIRLFVVHTIIIPLQLAFKITIYIPFIKIPILDPLIYLLELQDFKIRNNEQWIINQINLFLITGIHYVLACLIIGAGVGIWMGVNLSLINLVFRVPQGSGLDIPRTKENVVPVTKQDDRGRVKEETKTGLENFGKGVIIPDLLPNLSKSKILQKIQQDRFLHQQQQRQEQQRQLAERRLAESQFQEIQRSPEAMINIRGELENEEPVVDDEYGEAIEVVGLEDDGYAYTGGLRNRIDKSQQVGKQGSNAKVTSRKNTTRVEESDESESKSEQEQTEEEGIKEVHFEPNAIEEPVLKPIPGPDPDRTHHDEEQEVQGEVDADADESEGGETSTTDEGALSNIPEETEDEEEEEEEEEVFTSRAETTQNTLL
ncbi:hypothetical protein Cantr_09200 [Candida viswanathii]|uniref:Uncharacterized protein n=1 Tax=Candida viswanathii TaxID=5486 RepID=A0A367YA20_9ASCO|nr:hypothetical protein Cantr_09200 [Candida viswanathii]